MMELKALQDWFVLNQLKSVPNVVDVNIFGGPTREYQVQVDSGKLVSFGLSLSQVEQVITNNNTNAGEELHSEGTAGAATCALSA